MDGATLLEMAAEDTSFTRIASQAKMEIVRHRGDQVIVVVKGSDPERLAEITAWLNETKLEPGDRFELRERKR